MSASRLFLACSFLLQGAIQGLASPLLTERDNSFHLNCPNAPNVIAGNYLDPKDAITPPSGNSTCQAEYEYLFCAPGTSTYIFFGILKPTQQPDTTQYATALRSTVAYMETHIDNNGDGPIPWGVQYYTTSSTNVQIEIENANNHNLTYRFASSAIGGLRTWMATNGYSDATFQINDGKDWVGSGYIGPVNAEGRCVFESAAHANTMCMATNEGDYVYGYDGGRFCDFHSR